MIALSTLKAFWSESRYTDSIEPLQTWYQHALRANWKCPAEVKRDFASVSILQDGRVIFNIAGNKYQLVVWINYSYRVVSIRFIGKHAHYDRIDAQSI